MKKIAITILTAPLVGIMTASAGEEVVPVTAPSSCACVPYFGISYVDGEQSLISQSYDVSGLRFVGGVDLGNGYSVDARYEKLSGDFPISETQTQDLDSDELRILLNRDFELSETLNLFGGIGYGWRDISAQGSSIGGDGVLANLGLEYSTGHYFASLVYTHCFTQNTDFGLKKEDFGYLEATVGYDITEQLAATLAYECNVYGDQHLEKDHVIAIGLNYSF
jgi:opacity protein-like surface antigen